MADLKQAGEIFAALDPLLESHGVTKEIFQQAEREVKKLAPEDSVELSLLLEGLYKYEPLS